MKDVTGRPRREVPSPRIRRWSVSLALAAALLGVSGCRTFSFYGQAIQGQFQLLAHEQPIEKLISDSHTPPALKERLQLVRLLRAFAAENLKLPVDGHYQRYVDLHRPFVVWNVEAAPEFSLKPKSWWYPLVGRLEYRGYFSQRAAESYAASLTRRGQDVFVGGVQAYSTLGWFKDPLLSTFIFEPTSDLAEIIFHELAHQRLFARGDTDFDEAFATTVGQEGARRWLRAQADTQALQRYEAQLQRTVEFSRLIQVARQRLLALYGDELTPQGKIKSADRQSAVPPGQLRLQKQSVLRQLQEDYLALRVRWGGTSDYDSWFANALNNAKLNSVAAYYDLVPGFQGLLAANGADLEKFYHAAERLTKLPKELRHQMLIHHP